MEENPQSAEESKNEYMRKMHWAVLQQCGLPPLGIVKIWLSFGATFFFEPGRPVQRRFFLETVGRLGIGHLPASPPRKNPDAHQSQA
jgi:hypothetical protein